jgi:putative transposase
MKRSSRKRWAKTIRLPGWDYTSPAWYFVTICTKRHLPFFREIIDGEMMFSLMGEIAQRYWMEIPAHHVGMALDAYTIMPNHIHGIIIVLPKYLHELESKPVETLHATSLQRSNRNVANIAPRTGSLSVIIRSYKSAVSRWAHQNGFQAFGWQPRYYDHIIRTQAFLHRIRTYIAQNPARWSEDKYYPSKVRNQ